MFTLCRTCSKLWCSQECHQPTCKEVCIFKVNWQEVKIDFCLTCINKMTEQFEKQMSRRLLPKRIRFEEVNDD